MRPVSVRAGRVVGLGNTPFRHSPLSPEVSMSGMVAVPGSGSAISIGQQWRSRGNKRASTPNDAHQWPKLDP